MRTTTAHQYAWMAAVLLYGGVPAGGAVVVMQVPIPNQLIGPQHPSRPIDFNADGTPELMIFSNGQDAGGTFGSNLEIQGIPAVSPNLGGWATPVALMGAVAAAPSSIGEWYTPTAGFFTLRSSSTSGSIGFWPTGIFLGEPGPDGSIQLVPESGYLGVRFTLPDGVHYGWVEVGVYPFGNAIGYVRSYGWGTDPGVSVLAGTPEPGRGIFLLIGAASAMLCRRRRALGSG